MKFNPPFNKVRTYIGINTNPFEPLRQSSCAILVIQLLNTTMINNSSRVRKQPAAGRPPKKIQVLKNNAGFLP